MEGHKFPPEQSELHNYVKIEIILPNPGLQKKRWGGMAVTSSLEYALIVMRIFTKTN